MDRTPLLGYPGMPALFTLPDGRKLTGPEILEAAFESYEDAHQGISHADFNAIHDDMRQAACEIAMINLGDTMQANTQDKVSAQILHDRAGATMWGDLVDAALTEVKALQRPWDMLGEDDQSEVLERITKRVKHAGMEAIRNLATRMQPSIVCDLESITVKKDAKATIGIGKRDLDEALLDAVGRQVLLIVAPFEELEGIQAPAATPNQRELGIVHSDPRD